MGYSDLQQAASELFQGMEFRMDEPMAKHTSFRIGGPAEVMLFPKCAEELAFALKQSKKLDIPCYPWRRNQHPGAG